MRADVLTSGIWQTNSTVLSHRGECLVVDPAYFPRELAAISARVEELGRARAVVFTHGHWDHVMGHTAYPAAPVWLHEGLARDIRADAPRAAKYLAEAAEFDSRWYVPRPQGHHWPQALVGLAHEERLELGGAPARALHLPGHSPDGLALVVEPLGLLLVGDYLSPCEIPFVEDAAQYRATLRRLIAAISDAAREVIPGHGPRLTAAEALAIAREDLGYVEQLLDAAARGDAAGAAALPWPRAEGVVGMRDAHLENCAKLGLAMAPP
ncbi:MAG: MBL fold metallo-hydrolase [Kofleriaceae bacterium]